MSKSMDSIYTLLKSKSYEEHEAYHTYLKQIRNSGLNITRVLEDPDKYLKYKQALCAATKHLYARDILDDLAEAIYVDYIYPQIDKETKHDD